MDQKTIEKQITSSVAAVSAALEELQIAVAMMDKEGITCGGIFPEHMRVKLMLLDSLVQRIETPHQVTETEHNDETETNFFFHSPLQDPSRN